MNYSKAICWIDDCRIPFVDEKVLSKMYNDGYDTFTTYLERGNVKTDYVIQNNTRGRFPANILVSDDMLNDGVISKTSQKNKVVKNTTQMFNYSPQREYPEIQDKGTNSRYYDIDKWFEKILDV